MNFTSTEAEYYHINPYQNRFQTPRLSCNTMTNLEPLSFTTDEHVVTSNAKPSLFMYVNFKSGNWSYLERELCADGNDTSILTANLPDVVRSSSFRQKGKDNIFPNRAHFRRKKTFLRSQFCAYQTGLSRGDVSLDCWLCWNSGFSCDYEWILISVSHKNHFSRFIDSHISV